MSRCKEQVMRGYHMGTCARNATKDGYCKQHHPDSIAERDRLREEADAIKQHNSIYSRFARLHEKHNELKATLAEIAKLPDEWRKDCAVSLGLVKMAVELKADELEALIKGDSK